MIQRNKKKLFYFATFLFGLVLTVFTVHKDNAANHQTQDMSKSSLFPEAHADTPYSQSGYYAQGSYGGGGGSDSGDAAGGDDASSDGSSEGGDGSDEAS